MSERSRVQLFVSTLLVASMTLAGNVCTWQGGSGRFSDANWDVAPVSGNGDTLVFDTSNGTAITVENDLGDDFAVYAIKTCAGTGWTSFGQITLAGQRLYFNATASRSAVTVIECGTGEPNRGAPLTFDLPLRFKGGAMKFSNTVVFNQKVTIDDDGAISLGWPNPRSTSNIKNVTFNGEIYGPNAAADIVPGNGGYGSRLNFNGKLTLKELWNNGYYLGGKPSTYFNKAGGEVKLFAFKYNHMIYFPVADVFGENAVIKDVSDMKELGVLTFQADQTIDRFVDAANVADNACRYTADKVAVVTMKASASTTVRNTFEGKLSLVWDPLDDYTFTLDDHLLTATNTMSGTIEVKGGTFAMKGGAHFTALSGLTVRSGATFSLADCQNASPLPSPMSIAVETGAKIMIPSGVALSASVVKVNGNPVQEANTYTSVNCDWIEGDGSVVYQPVMNDVGVTEAMNESPYNLVKCWTNEVLGISVPPSEVAAANYDYYVAHNGHRTPQAGGTYVWHCRSIRLAGTFNDCAYRGVVTNVIENEGLFLNKGSLIFMSGRYAESCWTGRITVTTPEGANRFTFGGGFSTATNPNAGFGPEASHMILAGTLLGAADVGLRVAAGDFGTRNTIDADASGYYGRLLANGANGWVTFGSHVFNGSVDMAEGCALGAERATDVAQLRNLSIPVATPLIVPVRADTKTSGSAGLIEVTGSFSQTGKVTVHPLGRLWHGRTPVLKLAAGCSGTLDVGQFELGGRLAKFRVPSDDAYDNWPTDLRLEVSVVDGAQVLSLVSEIPGMTVIIR